MKVETSRKSPVEVLLKIEVEPSRYEPILRKIRYVNLGGHKDFYKELVDAMYFPHKEKERFQT